MNSPQLSPVDRAQEDLDGLRRALAGAKRIALERTEKRNDAENAVSKLTALEAVAIAASAADRGSAPLAAKLTLARTQLEHARRDLAAAVEEDKQATARAAETSGHVGNAERVLEAAKLEARLMSGDFEKGAERHARAMVDAAHTAIASLQAIYALIEEDEAAVRRLHELGSTALGIRDGVTPAGFAAAALLEAGASFTNVVNVHQLRWVFDLPGRAGSQHLDATAAAAAFMRFVFDSLQQATRDARAGAPDRGKPALASIAKIWPRARSRAEVTELEAAAAREHAIERDRFNREAHERRLQDLTKRGQAKRGRAVDQNGKVVGPTTTEPQETFGAGDVPLEDFGAVVGEVARPGPVPRPDGEFIPEDSADAPGATLPVG